MPLAPLEQAQAGLTIPVAGGCGPGFHRGPYGGCRRNGYYGGMYYGSPAVVAAPGIVVAPLVRGHFFTFESTRRPNATAGLGGATKIQQLGIFKFMHGRPLCIRRQFADRNRREF